MSRRLSLKKVKPRIPTLTRNMVRRQIDIVRSYHIKPFAVLCGEPQTETEKHIYSLIKNSNNNIQTIDPDTKTDVEVAFCFGKPYQIAKRNYFFDNLDDYKNDIYFWSKFDQTGIQCRIIPKPNPKPLHQKIILKHCWQKEVKNSLEADIFTFDSYPDLWACINKTQSWVPGLVIYPDMEWKREKILSPDILIIDSSFGMYKDPQDKVCLHVDSIYLAEKYKSKYPDLPIYYSTYVGEPLPLVESYWNRRIEEGY